MPAPSARARSQCCRVEYNCRFSEQSKVFHNPAFNGIPLPSLLPSWEAPFIGRWPTISINLSYALSGYLVGSHNDSVESTLQSFWAFVLAELEPNVVKTPATFTCLMLVSHWICIWTLPKKGVTQTAVDPLGQFVGCCEIHYFTTRACLHLRRCVTPGLSVWCHRSSISISISWLLLFHDIWHFMTFDNSWLITFRDI